MEIVSICAVILINLLIGVGFLMGIDLERESTKLLQSKLDFFTVEREMLFVRDKNNMTIIQSLKDELEKAKDEVNKMKSKPKEKTMKPKKRCK